MYQTDQTETTWKKGKKKEKLRFEFPSSEDHPQQQAFIKSESKRIIVRAGRRGGKTVGVSIKAAEEFLKGKRILYAAPAQEQVHRFWATVCAIFDPAIERKLIYKNETEHVLEFPKTETRIRAKSAWNADTLRGDYADLLILDEWQLMNEDAWELVGAPMLLDRNGDVIFIYTPPSLHSRSVSKANDPQHAAKLFKRARAEEEAALREGRPSRWKTFHFSSMDNPYISKTALEEITEDMSSLAYRMEILAQDIDEAPGALWTREIIDRNRVTMVPSFDRVVVAIDPSATSTGDEAGIIGAGCHGDEGYLLEDVSVQGSPLVWASSAINLYHKLRADRIIAEANNGGEMVSTVIAQVDPSVPVKLVHASRGKQTRAEPVSARYEKDKVHHVGKFERLEDEMCLAGDTLIMTSKGDIPISKVKKGDLVLTRKGFRKVLWSGMTCSSSEVIEIKTRKGRNILTTINHPVYVKGKGFVKAGSLNPHDVLETRSCHMNPLLTINGENRSLLMASVGLSIIVAIIWIAMVGYCIERFGKRLMARSLREGSSTIGMRTGLISICQILNWCFRDRMLLSIPGIDGQNRKRKIYLITSRPDGRVRNRMLLNAKGAEQNSRLQACDPSFAIQNAEDDIIESIATTDLKIPVYNLTVEGEHEFYANGILVHNCLWIPGDASPNRMDAMVWAFTDLLLNKKQHGVHIMDAEPDPLEKNIYKCFGCGEIKETVVYNGRNYCDECYREWQSWSEFDDDDD